jgi:DNA-binding Lrp family transcriptional regulator
LEERTIKCLRIDSTVDEQVKYDIFERLNSGSVTLEAQELRNAVSRGPFNVLIKELAKDTNFRILLQVNLEEPERSRKVKKMEDAELVLRFFALNNNNYNSLRKGFKQFLSDEMNKMNKHNQSELAKMKRTFLVTMETIRRYFGDEAFAKYRYENGSFSRMSKFNAAVYDALAIPVAMTIDIEKPKISSTSVSDFRQLFASPSFFDAVSGSVNDREKVITRIEAAKRIILS